MSVASLTSSGLLDPNSSLHSASRRSMKQSAEKSPTVVGEDRTVVAERISTFLRDKYPLKTAESVAVDTGVAVATVSRWLDRGSAPNAWGLCQLVGAYGAEVLCAILDNPPPSLLTAVRIEERERVERQISVLRAQIEGGR